MVFENLEDAQIELVESIETHHNLIRGHSLRGSVSLVIFWTVELSTKKRFDKKKNVFKYGNPTKFPYSNKKNLQQVIIIII